MRGFRRGLLSKQRILSCCDKIISYTNTPTTQYRVCSGCNIEWKLSVNNCVYERNAYDTYYHFLKLSGKWICECCQSVLNPPYYYFTGMVSNLSDGQVGGNSSIGNPPLKKDRNRTSVTSVF